MANTIQSLFPIHRKYTYAGRSFQVYPCAVEFIAPLKNGKYVFDGLEEGTKPKSFGQLLQSQTGVIAGIFLSSNSSSAEFTNALDKPLELQILHGGNKTPVNEAPFVFSDFAQGSNFSLQWETSGTTTNQQENFLLQIRGSVNQIFSITEDELKISIVFNFLRTQEKI